MTEPPQHQPFPPQTYGRPVPEVTPTTVWPAPVSSAVQPYAPAYPVHAPAYSGYPAPAAGYPAPAAGYPAPAAGYPAPAPIAIVSSGGRLGAHLLEILLVFVTLFIGYAIWALIAWAGGQTPGKQLLGHVVANARTGEPFTWGQMFLRQFVVQGLLFGLLSVFTLGLFGLINAAFVLRDDHRAIHDLMCGSVVRHR